MKPTNAKDIKINYYVVGLLLLFIFHLTTNFIVIKNDELPLLHDAGTLYSNSLEIYKYIKTRDLDGLARRTGRMFKGSLTAITTFPIYLLFGVSQDTAMMTNNIYLFILLFSIYGIGRYISSEKTGFVAACICSFFPAVYSSARTYQEIFPLASLIALDVFLLLKSNYFKNRKYSILLGITLGLSALTKTTFSIYLFVPFLLTFLSFIMKKMDFNKKQLITLFFLIIIAITLALPGYRRGARRAASEDKAFVQKIISVLLEVPPLQRIKETVDRNVFHFMLSPFYLYLFIISLPFFLFFKEDYNFLLLSSLSFPLIFFWFYFGAHFYLIRHSTPCLIFFALIIATSLCKIHKFPFDRLINNAIPKKNLFAAKKRKISIEDIVIILVLLIGFLNLVNISYSLKDEAREKDSYYGFKFDIDTYSFLGRVQSHKLSWNPREVASLFYMNNSTGPKIFFFNDGGEAWWGIRAELKFKLVIEGYDSFTTLSCKESDTIMTGAASGWLDSEKCWELINSSSFVVFENIDTQHVGMYGNIPGTDMNETYERWATEKQENFVLIKRFEDYSGNLVEIYKNKRLMSGVN